MSGMVTALEEKIMPIKADIQVAIARYLYRNSPKDRAVARHEAGHCLAHFISRMGPLDSVSVDDFTASGEMVSLPVPRPDGMPEESRETTLRRLRREHPVELKRALGKQIVVYLSGRATDEYGESGLDRSCSRYDEAEADKLADLAVDRAGRDHFIGECRATSEAIIRDSWEVVVELGALIADFRRLPGNVVESWLDERARTLREEYPERYQPATALEED
jgi:hypothetical protein